KDIVRFYYGDHAARAAEDEWVKRFSKREDPSDIPEAPVPAAEVPDGGIPVFKLLVLTGLAKSGNEARRLLQGGGVTVGPEREKSAEPTEVILHPDGLVVRVGNRRVVRIRLQ